MPSRCLPRAVTEPPSLEGPHRGAPLGRDRLIYLRSAGPRRSTLQGLTLGPRSSAYLLTPEKYWNLRCQVQRRLRKVPHRAFCTAEGESWVETPLTPKQTTWVLRLQARVMRVCSLALRIYLLSSLVRGHYDVCAEMRRQTNLTYGRGYARHSPVVISGVA